MRLLGIPEALCAVFSFSVRCLGPVCLLFPQLSTSNYYFHVDREAAVGVGGEQQGVLFRAVNTSALSRVYVKSVIGVTDASLAAGKQGACAPWPGYHA